MNKAEGGEEFYQLITQARIWYEMYQRISCTDEIDAAKASLNVFFYFVLTRGGGGGGYVFFFLFWRWGGGEGEWGL